MRDVKCRHCEFTTTLETFVDKEGFAQQQGWDALKQHFEVAHPKAVKVINRYLEEKSNEVG